MKQTQSAVMFLISLAVSNASHIFLALFLFSIWFINLSTVSAITDPVIYDPSSSGVSSESSITISTSGNLVLNLAPTNDAGIFATSSDYNFSVSTNNYTGYTLSISTNDDTGKLIKSSTCAAGENSEKCYISSISESSTTITDNNTWGYRPSKYQINDTNNDNNGAIIDNTGDNAVFLPSPPSTASVLNITHCANGSTNGDYDCTANTVDNYTIAIGAKVNINLEPGIYERTFNLIVVSNPITYSISYTDNTGENNTVGSDVANLPASQIGNLSNESTSVTLDSIASNNVPTRTGYTFIGWCSVQTTNSGTTCSTGSNNDATNPTFIYDSTTGTFTPNTYAIDHTADNTNLKLYAMWQANQYTCTKQYRLQNADGTFPDNYTADGTEQVNYGATCTYTKSVTDYKNSASGTNGASATASSTMTTNGLTLSLDFYRNTYALTVDRNTTYISSASATTTAVHDPNYYRWGQEVSITATASTNNEFTTWSQTSPASPTSDQTVTFDDTTSASTTITMPKSDVTIYAEGETGRLYMWNATSADCGQVMYDNRDGIEKAYTTTSIMLGDSVLCWMTTNLSLGTDTTVTLTPDNTNITSDYILPASSATWTSGYTVQNVYNAGLQTCSDTQACYGYYTYATATAGINPSSSDATSDICPKGWRLPTKTELTSLINTYTTGADLVSSPFYAVYAGGFIMASFSNGGSNGLYWSSTPNNNNSNYAYYLSFYNNGASIGNSAKGIGCSIRCVKEMEYPYMQDVDINTLTELMPNIGDATILKDKRDEQRYSVAKLADGKYWMTSNLNIAGNVALSSGDTDFESTYTLPTTNGWTVNNGKLVLPASSASFGTTDNVARLYNSGGTTCGNGSACYSYYSWDAATLGSGRTIKTNNQDAPYSICPKGWKLPTSRNTSATNWQTTSDFYTLAHQYGLDSTTSTTESDSDFYNQAGYGNTPNFLLSGWYNDSTFKPGASFGTQAYGFYWSATSYSSNAQAYNLYFSSGVVNSANYGYRRYGGSVRCLFNS